MGSVTSNEGFGRKKATDTKPVPQQTAIAAYSLSSEIGLAMDGVQHVILGPGFSDRSVPEATASPYTLIEAVPADSEPLAVGEFVIWPDPVHYRAFFALIEPRLRNFSLTVRREVVGGSVATTGGTAVVTLSSYIMANLSTVDRYEREWSEALRQAGHDVLVWRFRPLNLRALQSNLSLPQASIGGEPHVTGNTEDGTATVLLELSSAGAQAWKDALEMGRADLVEGICRLGASYYTRAADQVGAGEHQLQAPLGTVLTRAKLGPDVVRTINPKVAVEARFIVVGSPTIESVVVDWRPNGEHNQETLVFGPAGGQFSAILTVDDVESLKIDWTATVTYRPTDWPVVHLSGELSSDQQKWSEIIKPSSWIRSCMVMTSLLDDKGDVVSSGSSADLDPKNRVQGELTFSAPYLDGGLLRTVFETSTQQIIEASFPLYLGKPPGDLRLMMVAFRDPKSGIATRALRTDETLVFAKVDPDAQVDIVTNRDPVQELSYEGNMLKVLGRLEGPSTNGAVPRPTLEDRRLPSISGPATVSSLADPLLFYVDPGDNDFYAVEVAKRWELLDSGNYEGEREPTDFYASWEQLPYLSYSPYILPPDVRSRVTGVDRLYYRMWTSASDTSWENAEVTTRDEEAHNAPYVQVVAGTTTNDDLRDLLAYLGFSYEYFAPHEQRYFESLGARLRDHNIIGQADLVDRDTFRAYVRAFQSQTSLSIDGMPGEDTLWEFQAEWARSRYLEIEPVEADVWVRPGHSGYDPNRDGYNSFNVREDVVPWYEGLRTEVNALGGLVTSAGAFRQLEAAVTAGRSTTSMHYSGLALDLATRTGMQDPDVDPYVITQEGDRWRVWARAEGGSEQTLQAVVYEGGRAATRTVTASMIDFTALAERYGFRSISPRSCFPEDYMCAEWWHFQWEPALIPGMSQFGIELLSLSRYSESELSAAGDVWANRKRIFKRARNGWY